jgi:hypothetical protein
MASSKFVWIFYDSILQPKKSISFTIHLRGFRQNGRSWSLFLFGWIFWLPPNHDYLWEYVQDHIHYILGSFCLSGHVIWTQKCSPNLSMGRWVMVFKGYFGIFILYDFKCFQWSRYTLIKVIAVFCKCKEFSTNLTFEKCMFSFIHKSLWVTLYPKKLASY